jgi:S-sulfo-L-cysteine synthase (O-acetyl-L-serine-dependent)
MYAPDPAAVVIAGSSSASNGAEDPRFSDPLIRAIGHTPLLPLRRIVERSGLRFELYAKAEFLNPTGSVKDRAAWGMVRAALDSGALGPDTTLIDASSGNTAVAYATLGARLGFKVELVVPSNANLERLARIRACGARLIFSDPAEGTDGAQREARRRAAADPARYFYPDQYNNPANPDAHFRTTGPEIWEQTDGRVTDFVAGVGTGGTITGTARFLRSRNPEIRVTAVEPTGPIHGLEGLKHLPSALRPSTYDDRWIDETLRVETEASAEVCVRLGSEEGLFVGPSSGAAVAAALQVGERQPGGVVVTLLPDSGRPDLVPSS